MFKHPNKREKSSINWSL